MTRPSNSTLRYGALNKTPLSPKVPLSFRRGVGGEAFFNFLYTGLSGMKKLIRRNRAAGSASAQNIHRQPHSTLSRAISMFTTCAARMPSTMVIWFMLTMRPRISVGLTSAIYIGAKAEATPMPIPPMKRAILNKVKSLNRPVPMAETVNSTAENISNGFRPYLSAATPATMAPARQPTSAVVIATPCIRGESLMPKNNS